MSFYITVVILLPFAGSLLIGALYLYQPAWANRVGGYLASGAMLGSFMAAVAIGFLLRSEPDGANVVWGRWLDFNALSLPFEFVVDGLALVMILVVTGVGLLIHVYSIGYMQHDESRGRYFSFLNLFCGFMLILVTAGSLPLLFVGWEGVGLCSYLLIGFWYSDQEKAFAGRKAFVVNRVGDAALLVAMFLIFMAFGSLSFESIANSMAKGVGTDSAVLLEIICLLVFVGCVGKSAQFPLYIWLPDAMAGPTPVSALIHAATMVTGGVYLLGRMSFMLDVCPLTQQVIAVVGCFTACFAAWVALFQRDIKKVLAFSTVSQLGFMIMAMGVGAYAAGVFHLATHAYFKALLFLSAGSVIHAMNGEQDMYRMGGLITSLAATTLVFIAGFLTIIGFPFTSGWFSKDAILIGVLEQGYFYLFLAGCVAAVVTAVYMSRLFALTFLGRSRATSQVLQRIHESPKVMLIPMWILSGLALAGGWKVLSFEGSLGRFFSLADSSTVSSHGMSHSAFGFALSLVCIIAVIITVKIVLAMPPLADRVESKIVRFFRDECLWNAWSVSSMTRLTSVLSRVLRIIDERCIDATVNGLSQSVVMTGRAVKAIHMGMVQIYGLILLVGATLLTVVVLLKGIY